MVVINTSAKDPELLIKLCDLQYTEEMTRLLTWGIEGESYTVGTDGVPTFVDEIKTAENPWTAGDKWGMRASASFRPGLQLAIDTRAFIDFAANDKCYIDGKVTDTPWETAFPNENWPDSDKIPPNLFAPPVSFTTEEAQNNSTIMTAVKTYVDEYTIKFIKGEEPLSNWDSFVNQLKSMNYQQVVDLYNQKAAEMVK